MSKTLTEYNHRYPDLNVSKVREYLPEYFLAEYPNIVLFLEKYFDYMDSDDVENPAYIIRSLLRSRDIHDTTFRNLDRLLKEFGLNLLNTDHFSDPRFILRLLGDFYRKKGSLNSAEDFFRIFYGIEAEISYPKKNIFTVNESLLGPEQNHVIQNGRLYQIYSVLIKTDLSLSEWEVLYKSIVHPAGFYLGAETVIVRNTDSGINDALQVIFDSDETLPVIISDATTFADSGIGDITNLSGDSVGNGYRFDPYMTIEPWVDITLATADSSYSTIGDAYSAGSITFDQDSSGSTYVKMSSTIPSFDQDIYPWYDSDSA